MKVLLRGKAASPGAFHGRVRLIKKVRDSVNIKIKDYDIIVLPYITPFHLQLILSAGAIITDHGGVTSHAASIARELGIPCVVATERATKILKNGMEVFVDGDEGIIYK